MYKHYRALSQICFTQNVRGRNIRVKFEPVSDGSFLCTSDKDVIEAVESSSYYKNNWIRIDEVEESEETNDNSESTEGVKDAILVESVTNFTLAKEYLIEKFGIESRTLRKTEDVMSVAKELNISFPNW